MQYGPQLEGTIVAIHPGKTTTILLKDAQEAVREDGKFHYYPTLTVTIGSGRFVGPGHWQAVHDTMDLFVGEAIAAMPGHVGATISGQPNPYFGVVRRIDGHLITLQRVYYVGDTAHGYAIDRLMPNLSTFHIAPYSRFS